MGPTSGPSGPPTPIREAEHMCPGPLTSFKSINPVRNRLLSSSIFLSVIASMYILGHILRCSLPLTSLGFPPTPTHFFMKMPGLQSPWGLLKSLCQSFSKGLGTRSGASSHSWYPGNLFLCNLILNTNTAGWSSHPLGAEQGWVHRCWGRWGVVGAGEGGPRSEDQINQRLRTGIFLATKGSRDTMFLFCFVFPRGTLSLREIFRIIFALSGNPFSINSMTTCSLSFDFLTLSYLEDSLSKAKFLDGLNRISYFYLSKVEFLKAKAAGNNLRPGVVGRRARGGG